jgi:molecular chaperone IbpA
MTKTLTLRSLDIPQLHKFGIGFDNMFDEILRMNAQQPNNNYPPYNIVQINEDEYTISIAVAGFGQDELSITKEKNILVVEGKHAETVEEEETKYLHKGISERNFRREFQLAEHVVGIYSTLELGILSIHLKREVPEEQKPMTIAINYIK